MSWSVCPSASRLTDHSPPFSGGHFPWLQSQPLEACDDFFYPLTIVTCSFLETPVDNLPPSIHLQGFLLLSVPVSSQAL